MFAHIEHTLWHLKFISLLYFRIDADDVHDWTEATLNEHAEDYRRREIFSRIWDILSLEAVDGKAWCSGKCEKHMTNDKNMSEKGISLKNDYNRYLTW